MTAQEGAGGTQPGTAGAGTAVAAPEPAPPAPAQPAPPAERVPGGPDRHRVYLTVFGALGALTLMELSVNRLVHAKDVQVALLIPMMLSKATLVVLYYMHLRYDSRVLRWALLVPLVMATFLVIASLYGGF